jgi:PAS domain S-box-containing protein
MLDGRSVAVRFADKTIGVPALPLRGRTALRQTESNSVAGDVALTEAQEYARSFLARVTRPVGFDVLFDYLPDVYFFVKDADGRFIRANRAFLGLVRASGEEDVIGAKDSDFFSANWAENYTRDDREVVRLAEGIVDKAELVRHADGSVDWFCTTKLPLLDAKGSAIGICGIMRDVKKMTTNNERFLSWAPVLETILRHYASPLGSPVLAEKMGLSVSQFNRQFKRRFQATPRSYVANVRLNAACHFLMTTELSISDIAFRTGFYDQSHFTNQFVKVYGTPPSKYRALHAQPAYQPPLPLGPAEGDMGRPPSEEPSVFSEGAVPPRPDLSASKPEVTPSAGERQA